MSKLTGDEALAVAGSLTLVYTALRNEGWREGQQVFARDDVHGDPALQLTIAAASELTRARARQDRVITGTGREHMSTAHGTGQRT